MQTPHTTHCTHTPHTPHHTPDTTHHTPHTTHRTPHTTHHTLHTTHRTPHTTHHTLHCPSQSLARHSLVHKENCLQELHAKLSVFRKTLLHVGHQLCQQDCLLPQTGSSRLAGSVILQPRGSHGYGYIDTATALKMAKETLWQDTYNVYEW